MQTFAANLASHLSNFCDLTLYTLAGLGLPSQNYPTRNELSGNLTKDARLIGREPADCWLFGNAGYAAICPGIRKPCVVFCNGNDFLNPWVYPPRYERLSRALLSAPVVWRYGESLRRRLIYRNLRRGMRRCSLALAISRYSSEKVCSHFGLDPSRVKVIPPGVEDDFFQDRAAGDPNELRVLTVARLTKGHARKNVEGVIRSLSYLRDVPVRYTIAGGGNDRPRLESLAAECGVADRVRFCGEVTREELLSLYRNADLFILAPKATSTDVEGFGIVYLEASASGVPVLGSRAGGAVDGIRDGVNGILIDNSEPESIAGGIRRFLELRSHFSPSTVRAFAEGFRWKNIASQVFSVLANAVE